MKDLTTVIKSLLDREFKKCDDIANSLTKSELIRLITQKITHNMITKDVIIYLADIIDNKKISLSDMTFMRVNDRFIKMLYKNKSYIYRNFSFFDICKMLSIFIDASINVKSRYIENRMNTLANSCIMMRNDDPYEWHESLYNISDDVGIFIYSKLRRNRVCTLFQYDDSRYWSHGGTEIFNHESVAMAISYINSINPESMISDDILNMDLSYDNWIRVKNAIIPLLRYNINNVSIIQGIIDIVGFRLSDNDILIIRESLKESEIPLEDFTSYGYILSEHDVSSSEISKDIHTFLVRGGNISTINIASNGTVYITYDMLYIFASKFNKNSYKALQDDYILNEFIHLIPILDSSTVSNIVSYVLSSEVYKYPSKLVDYLISYIGFSIVNITKPTYAVLNYILSKGCNITESILLKTMVVNDSDILEYIPDKAIKYIDSDALFKSIRTSTKFYHNINKYLLSDYVIIPSDIVIYHPGYIRY